MKNTFIIGLDDIISHDYEKMFKEFKEYLLKKKISEDDINKKFHQFARGVLEKISQLNKSDNVEVFNREALNLINSTFNIKMSIAEFDKIFFSAYEAAKPYTEIIQLLQFVEENEVRVILYFMANTKVVEYIVKEAGEDNFDMVQDADNKTITELNDNCKLVLPCMCNNKESLVETALRLYAPKHDNSARGQCDNALERYFLIIVKQNKQDDTKEIRAEQLGNRYNFSNLILENPDRESLLDELISIMENYIPSHSR